MARKFASDSSMACKYNILFIHSPSPVTRQRVVTLLYITGILTYFQAILELHIFIKKPKFILEKLMKSELYQEDKNVHSTMNS